MITGASSLGDHAGPGRAIALGTGRGKVTATR